MKKYFIGTGTGNLERGVVVKETGLEYENKLQVTDELGNGAGWSCTVNKDDVKEISQTDYNLIISYNEDWTVENEKNLYQKVNELLES